MEFKDIIVKLRTEKHLDQFQLAKALNTSRSTVSMWELGKRFPSKEGYEAISDFFNVDIDYLYGRSDVRQKVHFDNDGKPMYYLNDETAKTAQEIFDNDRALFDVYNSTYKDKLIDYANTLKKLKDMENGDVD